MDRNNVLKESLGTFLHHLWDLMILNWLWLLCSLPIVTIGPATCGLYSVTLKLARREPVYPVKDFFRGFRDNFKAGLILGLLALALLAVAVGDAYFALTQTGTLRSMYLVIAIVVASLLLTLTAYGFALQAMFDNPLKLQFQNVVKLAFVAPGKTMQMWLILLLPVIVFLLLPPVALGMLGFVFILLGVSGPVYLSSYILRRLFDTITRAAAGEND